MEKKTPEYRKEVLAEILSLAPFRLWLSQCLELTSSVDYLRDRDGEEIGWKVPTPSGTYHFDTTAAMLRDMIDLGDAEVIEVLEDMGAELTDLGPDVRSDEEKVRWISKSSHELHVTTADLLIPPLEALISAYQTMVMPGSVIDALRARVEFLTTMRTASRLALQARETAEANLRRRAYDEQLRREREGRA